MPEPPVEPLSVRSGDRALPSLHAGVPPHLKPALHGWLRIFLDRRLQQRVALRMGRGREPLPTGTEQDLLDVVDYALQLDRAATDQLRWSRMLSTVPEGGYPRLEQVAELAQLLDDAGSIYTVGVRDERLCVLRRVDPTVQAAADHDAAAADPTADPTAGQLLRHAWNTAYAREPDPTTAYRDAVRAVEQLACPLVLPHDNRATLGKVISHLKQGGSVRWRFALVDRDDTDTVDPLVAILERLWTGQVSRHGGGRNSRDQTQAEAAVHLAATLVQLLATGALARRDDS